MNNAIEFPKENRLPDPEPQQAAPKQKILYDERGMIDLPFLLLTVLLVTIGVIMMFSASYASAYATEESSTYYFARQGLFAVVGVGIMLFVSRLNYQMWRALSFPILGVTLFLMMITPIFGLTGGGATRWIQLGPLSFQPSEVAKLAVILSFAAMISQYKDRMQTFRGLIPFVAILGLMVLTLIFQKHLSGIVIICAVAAAMLGRSRQKYLYLPEEHNDYIFPIVCEELGFVGAMVVVLLFMLLIIRGYWIAMHARDRFGALMVGGITTLLALQVFFNIGVVTNFLPATGISLPFFSYGGTALLLQLFEMGLILSVSRQSNNQLLL